MIVACVVPFGADVPHKSFGIKIFFMSRYRYEISLFIYVLVYEKKKKHECSFRCQNSNLFIGVYFNNPDISSWRECREGVMVRGKSSDFFLFFSKLGTSWGLVRD